MSYRNDLVYSPAPGYKGIKTELTAIFILLSVSMLFNLIMTVINMILGTYGALGLLIVTEPINVVLGTATGVLYVIAWISYGKSFTPARRYFIASAILFGLTTLLSLVGGIITGVLIFSNLDMYEQMRPFFSTSYIINSVLEICAFTFLFLAFTKAELRKGRILLPIYVGAGLLLAEITRRVLDFLIANQKGKDIYTTVINTSFVFTVISELLEILLILFFLMKIEELNEKIREVKTFDVGQKPYKTQSKKKDVSPVSAETQHCPYCGAIIPMSSTFCTNCGKKIK